MSMELTKSKSATFFPCLTESKCLLFKSRVVAEYFNAKIQAEVAV